MAENPFQLDPNDFKTGNMIVDGAVKAIIKSLNKMDMNKDGVADISQFAPIVLSCIPCLVNIYSVIDWNKVYSWALSHVKVGNTDQFKTLTDQLGQRVKAAEKLFPKQNP